MEWSKWLAPQTNLSDELQLEIQIRILRECKDLQQISELTVMLLRQNHSYSEIIKNATRYIAELEMSKMFVHPQ
jgi:hypothetical protein